MKTSPFSCQLARRSLALFLLLPLAIAPGAAHAQSGEREPHPEDLEVKSRVIVKTKAGEQGSEDSYSWVVVSDDGATPAVGPIALKSFRMNRGYLGVLLLDLTPDLRRHFGAPEESGVMISQIAEDSPAETAGLRVADVVTALDGDAVANSRALARHIAAHDKGDSVTLEIWRDGKRLEEQVEIGERQRPQVDVGPVFWTPEGSHLDLDAEVYAFDPERLNEALEEFRERMGSDDWRRRVRRFDQGQDDLLKRLSELEERIRELEALLEERNG